MTEEKEKRRKEGIHIYFKQWVYTPTGALLWIPRVIFDL